MGSDLGGDGASSRRARLAIWVRPGSRRDALAWDAWRQRWVVYCRAPPVGGQANRSVPGLVAGWLGVTTGAVRWARAGSARAKELSIDGLSDGEVIARLRRCLGPADPSSGSPAGSPTDVG
ncbi:MAG TPA: DUF167 domain-containing protein [Thermoplasmata archaeon]|nr:DUF167 domain-containing protein [Thermoplasmata archaeon]